MARGKGGRKRDEEERVMLVPVMQLLGSQAVAAEEHEAKVGIERRGDRERSQAAKQDP